MTMDSSAQVSEMWGVLENWMGMDVDMKENHGNKRPPVFHVEWGEGQKEKERPTKGRVPSRKKIPTIPRS